MTSSVALVLDRHFGRQIDALAQRMPVWVIASTENHLAVELARSRLQDSANITEFFPIDGEELGATCSRVLYEIDEHHGPASAAQPYRELLIYGGDEGGLACEVAQELDLDVISGEPGVLCLRKHVQAGA